MWLKVHCLCVADFQDFLEELLRDPTVLASDQVHDRRRRAAVCETRGQCCVFWALEGGAAQPMADGHVLIVACTWLVQAASAREACESVSRRVSTRHRIVVVVAFVAVAVVAVAVTVAGVVVVVVAVVVVVVVEIWS